MPYYQDQAGGLHFLSDQDVEAAGLLLLPAGCVPVSDAQALQQELAAQAAPTVPSTVTRRQFKLALLDLKLLDTVNAAVAAMTDRVIQIDWADSATFDRNSTVVQALTQGDTVNLDQLFTLAATK